MPVWDEEPLGVNEGVSELDVVAVADVLPVGVSVALMEGVDVGLMGVRVEEGVLEVVGVVEMVTKRRLAGRQGGGTLPPKKAIAGTLLWPNWLDPQHWTAPRAESEQLCTPPAATRIWPDSALAGMLSCPLSFEPQHAAGGRESGDEERGLHGGGPGIGRGGYRRPRPS